MAGIIYAKRFAASVSLIIIALVASTVLLLWSIGLRDIFQNNREMEIDVIRWVGFLTALYLRGNEQPLVVWCYLPAGYFLLDKSFFPG